MRVLPETDSLLEAALAQRGTRISDESIRAHSRFARPLLRHDGSVQPVVARRGRPTGEVDEVAVEVDVLLIDTADMGKAEWIECMHQDDGHVVSALVSRRGEVYVAPLRESPPR